MGTIVPDMGSQANPHPIGAALFGATRQAVLHLFFGHPARRFYQRQIIRAIGLGSGAVQRELEQLTSAAILTRTVEGRQTYYQANHECPVFHELHGLVRKTFGVAEVLQGGLRPLKKRIQLAFIYGSVAAGIERAASDIDVMVVADQVSLGEVVSALTGAQRELQREINPSIFRRQEFCRKLSHGHHFLSSVVSGPKIFLIGDEGKLRRLAQERMAPRAQANPAGDRRPSRRRRSGSRGMSNTRPGKRLAV